MVCLLACQFIATENALTHPASIEKPEPWLSGTLTELPPIPRSLLHSLEMAGEDLHKRCGSLSEAQLHQRPGGVASVAFHLRHIAGSLDRLLTYAEGHSLTQKQFDELKAELDDDASTTPSPTLTNRGWGTRTRGELFADLDKALASSSERTQALASADLTAPRLIGRRQLPTTLGGLLIHIAEHTQRHVGQAITTAKIVAAT
jgi:DinB superfamily